MRALPASILAAFAEGQPVPCVLFVELQLSTTLYLCSAGADIDWNGHTWLGMGLLGSVGSANDSATELQPMQFNLSAVTPDAVALVLDEPVQGRTIIVRLAFLDPDTHAIASVDTVWSGTGDQMQYEESFSESGISTPVISLSAEHRGVAMQRPNPIRYTDADQQRLFSGDLALQYIVAQSTHQDVWPAAAFWRQ